MEPQNKKRKVSTKIMAMLMSAIYLAVSVNVPVLAQDVPGPITDDTYEGDVEVTAVHIFNNNMAGVYATDKDVSVGNNLSVTSNTDPNVNDNNVIGVYVTDANVSVGNNLSVDSERKFTKGIYAVPNANTADVTIGNDLTVASNNTDTGASTMGIEARPDANGTAKIKVGNPLTNQGDVTVTGTVEVKGINIASQGNTNITVGGDVTSSISESNGGSAKGVYLNPRADDAITNVNIGGAVDANGTTEAKGLEIKPNSHNTNKIDVGKGISSSAAEATGVNVSAQNTSNTTINIGKDSSGNAITVHSDGNDDNAANSSGINAQLNTSEYFTTGSTTATINVEGNIVVSSKAAGSRGIYADGGDRTNLNIQVKGDVTSNGAGIYTKDMSLAESTDIIIDGTVKSTADDIPAVILETTNVGNENVDITAWKIESNKGTALLGIEDNNQVPATDEDSQSKVANKIDYIIRVTQPKINNTPVNVISLANADGTAWNAKKAWNNGEGADPTMLDVAGENERVYVKLDVPDGYQVVGVYTDAGKTVALTKEADGRYSLVVPRGGGIDVNVDLKPDPKPEPVKTHTIRVETEGKGTATADQTSARAGQMISIKATSKVGYKFIKWTAANGVSLKDEQNASTSFIMPDNDVTVKAFFEKIYEAPQPELKPVGNNKINLSWQKVDGAKGYDIFMSLDNNGGKDIVPKRVKTIKGNKTFKWTATGLKPRKSYKALVKAYANDKNGKKKYISESPLMYVYTAGGNKTYTNAKSVMLNTSDGKIKKDKLTLKVKGTYQIKASVKKADKKKKLMPASHVKTLRYRSSDPGVVTVSSKGKITAINKGKCNIYVYAHNGIGKTIKVTVK